MSETATTTTEIPEAAAEAADTAFAARIRTSLALAQTRISEVAKAPAEWTALVPKLPAQLQAAVDRALESARVKLRDSLDLPSREDLQSLAQRIESLDHKIDKLSAETAEVVDAPKPRRKKSGGGKKTAGAVDKGTRRDAIKSAAKKSRPKRA